MPTTRTVFALCCVLTCGSLLAQQLSPNAKLELGTPRSVVAAAFGKPFERFPVLPNDENATIGAPTGIWEEYHLIAQPERLYVTMIHFGASGSGNSGVIDSLMLETDHVTVSQILQDQPAFASICRTTCDLVLVTNKAGNRSLLLRPKDQRVGTVLYFAGDSAGKWKSVTSMDCIVAWVYALPRAQFSAHHTATDDKVIGTWSLQMDSAK
jgi:hypothetical protein